MVSSHTSGELTFTFPWMTQCVSMKPAPKAASNTMRAIAIESSARSGAVTAPMNGLADQRRWASTMSRWRLLTGTSTGSHTVPLP